MLFNREELVKILTGLKPGLANKEVIENTNCFAFTGDRVCTYNDDIAISHPLETDFTAVIEAKTFYSYISKLKEEEIDIAQTEKGLLIKGKRAKANFPVRTEEIDMYLLAIGKAKGHKKLPDNFVEGLKLCLPSVSQDASRPSLSTIHICANRIQATDGFRISFFKSQNETEFLLQTTAAYSLINHKPTKVALTKGWISFLNEEGCELCTRTVEADVPDLSLFLKIPKKCDITLTSKLLEAIEKGMVFVADNGLTDSRQVTLDIKAKQIIITAKSSTIKGAVFKEITPCITGIDEEESFSITVIAEHMLNILSKTISCYLSEDGTKLVFKAKGFIHVMSAC